MSKISSFGLAALALLAMGTTRTANAQSTPARGETKTVTGCLQRDAKDAKDFNILDRDGIVWDLEGADKAKFEQHVGHTVTLTGKVEDVDRTSKSAEANGGQTKAELDVDQITMISASCQNQTSSAAPSAPLVALNTPPPTAPPQTPVVAQTPTPAPSTPPSQTYSTPTPATTEELPQTASSLPLVCLFGCVLLGAAFALRKMVRVNG